MKKVTLIVTGIAFIGIIGWLYFGFYKCINCGSNSPLYDPIPFPINSFSDCVKAGYPIMESYPRQCKTPEGRTFVEELPPTKPTYINATSGVITVETPTPGSVTGKEFEVRGIARGWYFEGSFPIEILDMNNKVLVAVPAQAQSDWMTSAPVSFIAKIKVPNNYIGKATVVLKKDNPSGLPKNDASMSFTITIQP